MTTSSCRRAARVAMRAARRLPIILTAGVLLAAPGCSSVAEEAGERAVEQAAENAAGEGADIDVSDDGVEIRSDDGTLISTRGELPDGFPDLDLLDGDIISAVAVEEAGTGYAVAILTDGDAEERLAEATALLQDQGFVLDESGTIPGLPTVRLTGRAGDRPLAVSISALADGPVTLQYLVTRDPAAS